MWKSVKLHFSVNTKILEFLKVHHFFQVLQNSVLFSNPYFIGCKELFSQKESKKNEIFDQKLLILRIFRYSLSKLGNSHFLSLLHRNRFYWHKNPLPNP